MIVLLSAWIVVAVIGSRHGKEAGGASGRSNLSSCTMVRLRRGFGFLPLSLTDTTPGEKKHAVGALTENGALAVIVYGTCLLY